jgi:hypothetical protein
LDVCPFECPPGKGKCTRVVGSKPGRCECRQQPCDANDFLNKSDEELFNYAVTPGNRIGAFCYITTSPPGSENVCKYYAKEAAGGKGIPIGSGCVVGAGSYSGSCFYTGPPLTNAEQASMCTTSFVKNGAAQMRYAIKHKLCCQPCEEDFLKMSDEELFNYAVTPGNRIGAFCYITTSPPGSGNACKYYAKEAAGGKGIPIGSGCVVGAGSYSGSCFYTRPPPHECRTSIDVYH